MHFPFSPFAAICLSCLPWPIIISLPGDPVAGQADWGNWLLAWASQALMKLTIDPIPRPFPFPICCIVHCMVCFFTLLCTFHVFPSLKKISFYPQIFLCVDLQNFLPHFGPNWQLINPCIRFGHCCNPADCAHDALPFAHQDCWSIVFSTISTFVTEVQKPRGYVIYFQKWFPNDKMGLAQEVAF